MERYAIFVDAGYFFAGGAQAAFGVSTPRKQLSLKTPANLVDALHQQAAQACAGIQLLRVYWYDAMPGPRLSLEQTNIALLAGVKLRLGALNSAGEQKGVDSLVVTDLIDLARNRAIADAVLISGDEDLRIAVQVAQSFGVRVHILAAGDPKRNVSPALQMEADSVKSIPDAWFAQQFARAVVQAQPARAASIASNQPAAAAPAPSNASTTPKKVVVIDDAARDVIDNMLSGLSIDNLIRLSEHFATQTSVPPEYDGKLIARTSVILSGKILSGDDMRHIRGLFVRAVRARVEASRSKGE